MKQQPSPPLLCCTDNLLLLPISGAFVALLGVLLIVLYLVTRGLTTSLYLVEGAIPSYVSAILLVTSGILTALLYVRPVQPLIFTAFILCVCCIIVCLVQAVTTLAISLPFLGSFTACVHKPSTLECQCYIFSSKRNNSFIADDTSNHHTFKGASTCPSIQRTLKDFLYIICIVYGFAIIACLFTAVLSVLLWCRNEQPDTEEEDGGGRETLNRGSTLSGTSDSAPVALGSSSGHQGTLGLSRVQESRETSSSPTTTRGHPQRRPRSSSVTSSQPSSGRSATRHHSFDTADISPPDRPPRTHRSRPPPILTKGGYLQSQLDGPTIPVYTLQGTNEAYISLTDLPSLQLPSLESVPAFIPELPEPDEEPPPYSPLADRHPTDGHPLDGHPLDGHPSDGHPTDSRPTDSHPSDGHPTDGYSPDSHAAVSHLGSRDSDRTEIMGAMVLSAGEGDRMDQEEGLDGTFVNGGACLEGAEVDGCTDRQQPHAMPTSLAGDSPSSTPVVGNSHPVSSVRGITPRAHDHQPGTLVHSQSGDSHAGSISGKIPWHGGNSVNPPDKSEGWTTASPDQLPDPDINPSNQGERNVSSEEGILGNGRGSFDRRRDTEIGMLPQADESNHSVDRNTRRDRGKKPKIGCKNPTEKGDHCKSNTTMDIKARLRPENKMEGRSRKKTSDRDELKRRVPSTPVDKIRDRKQRIREQAILANKGKGHEGGMVQDASPKGRAKMTTVDDHPRAHGVGRPKAAGKRRDRNRPHSDRARDTSPPSQQSLSEAVTLLKVRGHGTAQAGAGARSSPSDLDGSMPSLHEGGRVQDTKM